MTLFRFLARRSPLVMGVTVAGGVASGVVSTVLLAAVQGALRPGGATTERALTFTVACVLLLGVRIGTSHALVRLAQGAMRQLRVDLATRLLHTPLARLEELGTPRLLAVLTDDVLQIGMALPWIPQILTSACVVLGVLGYLAWLSPALFGFTAIVLATGIASYALPAGSAQRALRAGRDAQDRLFHHFRDLTAGVKELKIGRPRREAFLADLDETVDALRDRNTRGVSLYLAAGLWGSTLFLVAIGALLFLAPRVLSVADAALAGFTLAFLYLQTPLETVVGAIPLVARGRVAMERVEALGGALVGGEADAGGEPAPGPIALVGVEYRHAAGFTVGPIDLELRPGEIVVLAGGNGAGKTTLAKVVTGLYAPTAGELRAGGRACASLAEWRERFTAVFSDSHLFERLPVRGKDAEATARLAELRLDGKVAIADGRLSTTALSQGQRKRLMLLGAWLEDRPYYVFDEWAADQDPVFRDLFYRVLLPSLRARGRGVFAISHDERYFDVADRLLKLEDGRLVELAPAREASA